MATEAWLHANTDDTAVFIARVDDAKNYVVQIDSKNLTNSSTSSINTMLKQEAAKPTRVEWMSKESELTKMAESIRDQEYFNSQTKVIDTTKIKDASVIKYGPRADYEALQEYDTESARIMGEPIYADMGFNPTGPVARISSEATTSSVKGITVNERDRIVTGDVVNPYKSMVKQAGPPSLYDTIGGSDLTLFMLIDFPNVRDLDKPIEVQRKEIVMIELDGALSLSYSTLREKFPIRSLGSPNPKAYTKGIRTISGHIAFSIFTEDVLSELRGKMMNEINKVTEEFDNFESQSWASEKDAAYKYSEWLEKKMYYERFANNNAVQLLDDLPPFHILAMGASETTGTFSKMLIKNVTIIDENQYQGTEQPHILNKITWTASDIVPMHKVDNDKTVAISSVNAINESFRDGAYSGRMKFNQEVTGSSLLESINKDLYGGD